MSFDLNVLGKRFGWSAGRGFDKSREKAGHRFWREHSTTHTRNYFGKLGFGRGGGRGGARCCQWALGVQSKSSRDGGPCHWMFPVGVIFG